MLQHAIGVDVLTTFADVDIEDVSDLYTHKERVLNVLNQYLDME